MLELGSTFPKCDPVSYGLNESCYFDIGSSATETAQPPQFCCKLKPTYSATITEVGVALRGRL